MTATPSGGRSDIAEERAVRRFQQLAIFSVFFTYIVIFAGGLVRVSGAGLGCPDWPKCFGRWIPPTSISQLPPDIDPSKFNFTLAWIEYFNRVGGALLGFVLIWLAVEAYRTFKTRRDIFVPSILSLILVAFQGWLGSVVVATELEPVIVTVHMLLALVLMSILIFVAHRVHYPPESFPKEKSIQQARLIRFTIVLWVIGMLQILVGTEMREELELIVEMFPLLTGVEVLTRLGAIKHVHTFLGLIVVCATFAVFVLQLQSKEQISGLLKKATAFALILVSVQLALGVGFVSIGMTSILQLFHLWIASMYIGAVFIMYCESKRVERS